MSPSFNYLPKCCSKSCQIGSLFVKHLSVLLSCEMWTVETSLWNFTLSSCCFLTHWELQHEATLGSPGNAELLVKWNVEAL